MSNDPPALNPQDVETFLGYTFRNRDLLAAACERKSREFATLEFYGDAYLNLAVCLACWHAQLDPAAAVQRYANKHLRSRFWTIFGPRRGSEKEDFLETTIGAMSFEASLEVMINAALRLVDESLTVPPMVNKSSDVLHESPEFKKATLLGEATLKCVAVDLLRERHGLDGRPALQLHQEYLKMSHDLSNRISPRWSSIRPKGSPPSRRTLARRVAATFVEFGWITTRDLVRREFIPQAEFR